MTTLLTQPEVEIPRDRYGRPLVTPEGGGKPVPYTRCTTYVGCLEDTYNLSKWQQRMVALGLSQRPDYLLRVTTIGDPGDDKGKRKQLDEVCANSIEAAKGSAAATTGTALHSLTEMIDRGLELPVVPDAYVADLAAYKAATDHLTATHIEQFCVLDPLQIGGTPDRVVKHQGKRYIADVKTGSIEYGILKIAMQLAVYARSKTYDVATGERGVHDAELDRGIIIHLPAGTGECTLHWVDLREGWEAVKVARMVREKRGLKFKDLTEAFNPTPVAPQPAAAGPSLEDQIRACTTDQAVRDLWAAHASEWTDALTEVAKTHIATLREAS